MTDFNYRLTYNGNFRWQDFRSSNPHFTIGVQVRLDIMTYDNNSQTMLHIHNYHTTCEAQVDKHVKQTLSCFVGEGRIVREIFGAMFKLGTQPDNLLGEREGKSLFIAYHPQSRLAFLVSSRSFSYAGEVILQGEYLWHHIPLVDLRDLPLVLAIPLTNTSAK